MNTDISIDEILKQEQNSLLREFDFNIAWELGNIIYNKAKEANYPVAIEIYAFGQPLFLATLPGSCAENLEWMKRKRNTVLRTSHSSLYVGELNEQNHSRMETQGHINQAEYTDHGGSFPILINNHSVIGAVTVSGLASHEDHELAVWAIQQYLAKQ